MKDGHNRKAKDGVKTSVQLNRHIHAKAKQNCLNVTQAIETALLWYIDHPEQRGTMRAYYEANCLG